MAAEDVADDVPHTMRPTATAITNTPPITEPIMMSGCMSSGRQTQTDVNEQRREIKTLQNNLNNKHIHNA